MVMILYLRIFDAIIDAIMTVGGLERRTGGSRPEEPPWFDILGFTWLFGIGRGLCIMLLLWFGGK
jgi:hypothetical protein